MNDNEEYIPGLITEVFVPTAYFISFDKYIINLSDEGYVLRIKYIDKKKILELWRESIFCDTHISGIELIDNFKFDPHEHNLSTITIVRTSFRDWRFVANPSVKIILSLSFCKNCFESGGESD